MGQRSQMYVIAKKDNKYYLTANYYPWNYGERMISRARGTLEQIIDVSIKRDCQLTTDTVKLRRIMDINWDMHDIVLSSDIVKEFTEEYEEYWKTEGNTYAQDFFDFCFSGQDNNNGQMYMYIDLDVEKPKVKMCFIQHTFHEDSNVLNANEYLTLDLLYDEPGTWQEYMIKSEYYDTETILYTERNIKYIEEHTEMLSKEELLNILKNIASQYENDDKMVKKEIIAAYSYEHNDGDQCWSDRTKYYQLNDGSFLREDYNGYNNKTTMLPISYDEIKEKMVNIEKEVAKMKKEIEIYGSHHPFTRGGYSIDIPLKILFTDDTIN